MSRAILILILLLPTLSLAQDIRSVAHPPLDQRTTLYPSSREPLLPSPFIKLPITSITPKGWLRHQLDLMRDGMTGRLSEVSQWCKFEGNAWADPRGKGHSGWEEMPYWLKGYGDLGYVTGDERIIAEARKWIDAILASQTEDGWFGPDVLKNSLDKDKDGEGGKPDLWPHMIALNCLQSWYEYTAALGKPDDRVLPFMTRYFKWQLEFPEKDFMAGYWPKMRIGDNIESVYWLYNRTGEKWLLDLASKIHKNGNRWDEGKINWHGVNFMQGFREPAIYFLQTHDKKHRDAAYKNYDTAIGTYGQFPGGGFASDENARPGFVDPRQGFETCSVVEGMHSAEMLLRFLGDPIWADRAEDLAFNTLPAALTPDWKALHYLTSANQVQLDKGNKAPGIQNGGTMFSYSPFAVYRCCQHNVSHGWPYYAEELWHATSDRGLAANLYAESQVTAKVADGQTVSIDQSTDYPFSETVTFTLKTAGPVRFPLYLRIPKWCQAPELSINGTPVRADVKPLQYLEITNDWKDGDTLTLHLPMNLALRKWEKNQNCVSVDRGPLTFSLNVGERYSRYGGSDPWPETEVYPTTPWNYGLVLDDQNPAASFEVIQARESLAPNPFTHETAPIRLRAKARRIPQWKTDANNLIHPLQQSPVQSNEPIETIELIPMGAARLRITSFPVIGAGPAAHEWKIPPTPPRASHCFENDSTLALNDAKIPATSSDHTIPRMTFWPHKGTTEWVQYDFDKPRKLHSSAVYWFDDEPQKGQCRLPKSWKLLYRAGNAWKEIPHTGEYGVGKDDFNTTTFDEIETTAIRLQVQLQPDKSAGILEWKVE
jgi:Beta-L-arabinofuranosidase, GH127